MPPQADPRWSYIAGGITPEGSVRPMSFEILEGLASDWADLIPAELNGTGPASLLRMSRSLFAHAWFDYEFMAVACLVAFQAMKAAFRELYLDEPEAKPFRALVRRAHVDGILSDNIADLATTGVELRNLFSHPATQGAFTVGMAGGMLENTHRMVALIGTATLAR